MSKESSKKDSDDDDAGDDSDGHDASIKPEGDVYNVEQDGNQSISTTTKKSSGNVCAESSKKRNETLTDSVPLCVNDEVIHSVAKDVANEELKQFFEILNNMEDIDDDSYCKAVNHFHMDATLGKMFVLMPDKRRRAFILKL